MNNILYAILPFLLFGFVLEILLKGRFSQRVNLIAYNTVFSVIAIIHMAIGFLSLDNARLLSLMPVTAYFPIIITVFILSKRNIVDGLFTVFIGIIAAIIVEFLEKLYVSPLLKAITGIGGDLLCLIISLMVCILLGFVTFRFLRQIFIREKVLDKNNWYIDVALFFLTGLSVYMSNVTRDIAAMVLILLCNVSVFSVIVGYLNIKHKNELLQAERERITKQIEAERAEYCKIEQNIELGKRYRHDMRHHFSVIKKLVRNGAVEEAEKYIETLGESLDDFEQKIYCQNPIVNAVLSPLLAKAEQLGVKTQTRINIPKSFPFDNADVCAVLSNLIDNAINASARIEEESRMIRIIADCSEQNKLTVSVENGVYEEVALGSDGLPVARKSEKHGYGLASVKHIVEKYNGILHCDSQKDIFVIKAIMFAKNNGTSNTKRHTVKLHSFAVAPLALIGIVLSLNFMPATLSALESVPVLGKAVEIVNVRHWGIGWGDSGIQIEYPETNDEDANERIEEYLNECKEKFWWYFERKYSGYAGTDFTSEIKRNDERMLSVSMRCTINAGSSLTYQRFFTIDKQTDKIVNLPDLFYDGADYNDILSAEIKRQIEYRVESGDSYYGYGIFTSPHDMEKAFKSLHDPNFYIDENGCVVIVFDEGEIAPYNMGTPVFVIPDIAVVEIADGNGLLGGTGK